MRTLIFLSHVLLQIPCKILWPRFLAAARQEVLLAQPVWGEETGCAVLGSSIDKGSLMDIGKRFSF